jgi:hexokinase
MLFGFLNAPFHINSLQLNTNTSSALSQVSPSLLNSQGPRVAPQLNEASAETLKKEPEITQGIKREVSQVRIPSKIRAIFWDIDGVLLNRGGPKAVRWTPMANEVARRGVRGVSTIDLGDVILGPEKNDQRLFRGEVSEEELLEQINRNLSAYGLKEPFASLDEYHKFMWVTRKANEELVGFTEAMKSSGIIQGIITDRYPGDEQIVMDKAQERFPHVFDNPNLIFNSLKERLDKHNPALFERAFLALQREISDIKPEEVLFIDDSKENYEVAQSVGFQTIKYNEELPQIGYYPVLKELFRTSNLQQLKQDFTLSTSQMQTIVSSFLNEMKLGLEGKPSSLAMLSSFVDNPTGKEKGKYLALDLGGTNFRVLMVELKGEGSEPVVVSEQFKLKKEHITGTAEKLFDAIASFVKQFLTKHGYTDNYNLGFTFFFEVNQTDIDKGITVRMSKGFTAEGIVGRDVVELLKEAFRRQGITNVQVVSLDNDTVGTQVARAYRDTNTSLGVILGTGTNISIRLPMEMIKKAFSNKDKYKASQMILNMEAGSFNKNLPRTTYDELLDSQSTNPNQAWEEKMVSGGNPPEVYLGEIMRLVLLDLTQKGRLFRGRAPPILRAKGSLETPLMSKIEALKLSTIRGRFKARWYLRKLFISRQGLNTIQEISSLISTRSARIAATVIAASLLAIDPGLNHSHTAAIDGSLFEKYYRYKERMQEAFAELLGGKASQITTTLTHDGSGVGAAIIAAVAARSAPVDQSTSHQLSENRRQKTEDRGRSREKEPQLALAS